MANITYTTSIDNNPIAAKRSEFAEKDLYGKSIADNLMPSKTGNTSGILVVTSGVASWDAGEFVEVDIHEPVPPTPTYEYILLQNFVDGHSIGTPDTTGSGWSTWKSTVPYPGDWDEDYQEYDYYTSWYYENGVGDYKGHLVSTTEDDPIIDDRKPIDFSKYNITTGTPYGIFAADDAGHWNGMKFILSSNYGTPFTVEFFTFGRPNGGVYDTYGTESIVRLGGYNAGQTQDIQLSIVFNTYVGEEDYSGLDLAFIEGAGITYSDDSTLLHLPQPEYNFLNTGKSIGTWIQDWHHFAISMDNNYLYFFIDGVRYLQKPLSDAMSFELNGSYSGTLLELMSNLQSMLILKGMNSNFTGMYDGGYTQVAVATECKWTDDFAVPMEAY